MSIKNDDRYPILTSLIEDLTNLRNSYVGALKENVNGEIIAARKGYDLLGYRLDGIDSQLADIVYNINSVYLTIPKIEDRIQAIHDNATNYTNITIMLPDLEYVFTKTVNITKPNINIVCKGTIISGDFYAFQYTTTQPFANVSNFTDNNITVDDDTLFAVGDIVCLQGDGISFYSEIISVANNLITIADIPNFVIAGSLKLYKTLKMNSTITVAKFTKNTTTTKSDVYVAGKVTDVTIKGCNFEDAAGITFTGCGYCTAEYNSFKNVGNSCLLYDVCNITVYKNRFNYVQHAIRGVYCYGCIIEKNILKNGKSEQHSIGIEFSGSNGTRVTTKSCNNKILYNEVVNIQKGRPGSAIGGIHLNFNSHDNLIQGNICSNNGVGIYLENNNYDNVIAKNICSKNSGYYGVGILLDWDCSGNTIDGNTCDYNVGSVTAGESCGIEVRSGVNSGHVIEETIVVNNKCRFNGKCGLYVNGDYVSCSNNVLKNNGTDNGHPITAELFSRNCRRSTFTGNIIRPSVAKYSIYFLDPTNILFNENVITGSSRQTSVVYMENSLQYVKFEKNQIIGSPLQRIVQLKGVSGAGSKYVYANDNIIDGSNNGYAALELDYIDYFQRKHNALITNTTVIAYQCTNEIT